MPITVNLQVMLLVLILKMPDHFGKNENSKGFLQIKKKIKIQELTNHAIIFSSMKAEWNKNIFMYKTKKYKSLLL